MALRQINLWNDKNETKQGVDLSLESMMLALFFEVLIRLPLEMFEKNGNDFTLPIHKEPWNN